MMQKNTKGSANALRMRLFGLPGASDNTNNTNSNNRDGALELLIHTLTARALNDTTTTTTTYHDNIIVMPLQAAASRCRRRPLRARWPRGRARCRRRATNTLIY